MTKSTVAKELKMVWNLAMTRLNDGVINGHRVAKQDLAVAPIWRFSKEVEGVHLFTHGNREYWVISEKDVDIVTKGKGFFNSKDVEVKVRNFYLVPMSKDHKGRPCYTSYLTNLDTLVKQGILKECWGDITKSEMSEILGSVVKMLAEAQQVPVEKFKKLAKTLKIGSIDKVSKSKKEKSKAKKSGKSSEEVIHGMLDKIGQDIQEMLKQNQFTAEAPIANATVQTEPVATKDIVSEKKPVAQVRAQTNHKPNRNQKAGSGKPTPSKPQNQDSAVTQLGNELAALDLPGKNAELQQDPNQVDPLSDLQFGTDQKK